MFGAAPAVAQSHGGYYGQGATAGTALWIEPMAGTATANPGITKPITATVMADVTAITRATTVTPAGRWDATNDASMRRATATAAGETIGATSCRGARVAHSVQRSPAQRRRCP